MNLFYIKLQSVWSQQVLLKWIWGFRYYGFSFFINTQTKAFQI